jgi:N6-adenosine-specific RNA methylase IME4/ParB-like chromosome segregation protein Spo0J
MQKIIDAGREGNSDQLEFHPLADLFPPMEREEFDALVADIKANGLHEPIVVYDDQILDGRNRYRACQVAGVEPAFTVYTGDEPVSYVVSLNLRRRHLNESQRAMVASKLATLPRGANQHASIEAPSQEEAAGLLNVGRASVQRAREVQEHGAPELVHAVEQGVVSVTAAADIAIQPIEEQREIVARGEREILRAAQEIRAKKAEVRRAERIERLAATCNQSAPLPSDRRYAVLYADPPWHFKVYNEESGVERAAGNHYPTMSLDDICALPVPNLASADAALFMWTTAPPLRESFDVLAAWGFEYKTTIVWVKDKIGLGYFVRNQHELLLVAARGDMPSPLPANRPASVISAPRREHSRKPDEAYELIERMYPELPKIELFARQARRGWSTWGNEVPGADDLDIPDFLRRAPAPSSAS